MQEKKEIEDRSVEWYISHRHIYKKLASKVESILVEILDLKGIAFHMTESRVKEIESFRKKITADKYDDPINQITDLAGIRIITYVEDEVKLVCELVEETFSIDNNKSLDKSKELGLDKVGYKSVHYIACLKLDRLSLPEYGIFENKYFEIQVRTILQHAWAEIEHDRNYKFSGKLPDAVTRRFKLLSGALEMADMEFNNIAKDIDKISREIEIGTKEGKLNYEINSTSLRQYIETKFNSINQAGISIEYLNDKDLLMEIEKYGIESLEDLDKIVPKDFAEIVAKYESNHRDALGQIGLIRTILIINDADKYFTKSWSKSWGIWSDQSYYKEVFNHYSVDWNQIKNKYGVIFNPKTNDLIDPIT